MRIISFNANGIRSAASKGFFEWLKEQKADVTCIQETKAQEDQLGDEVFRPRGQHRFFKDASTKKGYSGVGVISRIKPGSIGPAAEFNEVKIDPATGEILVRGPNVFAGYLNLPEKTAETIDADGWLHTGDVGLMDEDGYFRITDRMKDIIITAGGKNITPSELENELKFSPYVTDAVVIGDKRPYLTVIIMIDQENVEKYAQDHDVPFSNYSSLTRSLEVQALIQGVIDDVNKKFARVEQIKKFFLLETQLSAEDEELTPTMKLKRKLVEKKYAEQIEAMYR